MNIWLLAAGFLSGVALGGLYFAGLHWTTGKVAGGQWPMWTALVSFAARTAIAIAVFAGLTIWSWQAATIALAGFVAARFAVLAWTAPRQPRTSEAGERS
jgi:F1F0 ATPase subunit 2